MIFKCVFSLAGVGTTASFSRPKRDTKEEEAVEDSEDPEDTAANEISDQTVGFPYPREASAFPYPQTNAFNYPMRKSAVHQSGGSSNLPASAYPYPAGQNAFPYPFQTQEAFPYPLPPPRKSALNSDSRPAFAYPPRPQQYPFPYPPDQQTGSFPYPGQRPSALHADSSYPYPQSGSISWYPYPKTDSYRRGGRLSAEEEHKDTWPTFSTVVLVLLILILVSLIILIGLCVCQKSHRSEPAAPAPAPAAPAAAGMMPIHVIHGAPPGMDEKAAGAPNVPGPAFYMIPATTGHYQATLPNAVA